MSAFKKLTSLTFFNGLMHQLADMNEIVKFLTASQIQYLATVGLDGKPKVRPFQFMFEDSGKLWFCTSNQKQVFKELEKNPYIELCASGKNMSWLRLEGQVIFSDNFLIKEKVFKKSNLVKNIYKEPTNSLFEVFYLTKISASITEIGKIPKLFSF